MVKAKLANYYTFRVDQEQPLKVTCTKWDETGGVEGTYRIDYENRSPMGGCSCPAWKTECKHRKCVEEAIADGKINDLWNWKWDPKAGWQRLGDVKDLSDTL